jgi:Protein of unknown function (DUF2924)
MMELLHNTFGIESELNRLSKLNLSELRAMWFSVLGSDAPVSLSPNTLKAAIAYHVQQQTHGGLSKQMRLRLKALMGAPRHGSATAGHAKLIKPGTKFLREWQNKVHEVQAIAAGKFIYDGRSYNSLTVIAREITGTHQSGPKFFGLKRIKFKPSKLGTKHG